MSHPKKPAGTTEPTIETHDGELSDDALEQVTGGTMTSAAAPVAMHKVAGASAADGSVNKQKTADKAYTQMDKYLKQ